MADVLEVTDATFGDVVLASPRPVLVDFWAPWCAPCRLVSPVVQQIGEDLADQLTVVKLDIDENVATATQHAIFSIPTLVVFRDGVEVERIVGFRRRDDLLARLRPHLA
jgi:thioredoxin 1